MKLLGQFEAGRREGVKQAIEWLAKHSKTLDDPNSQALIDDGVFELSQDEADRRVSLSS